MEPLKEMFNGAFYKNFAEAFAQVYTRFDKKSFINDVTTGLHDRSLNERLRHTSVTLKKYLPENYRRAVSIMKETAPLLQRDYTALILPDYVGLFGKHDIQVSLDALKYFTGFGSSEFAVREFLKIELEKTLRVMETWAEDENHHVRRLASEGSRPRLPWSFRLDAIVGNPSLTKNIVSKLKSDQHIYVKKSVANHLNDISKDHPEYLIRLLSSWDMNNLHTRWIIKHACRTLIKKGSPAALNLFSVKQDAKVIVKAFKVESAQLKLGDALQFSFVVVNEDKTEHRLVIDYAIIYARPGKTLSRKVFKLKEITLASGARQLIKKKQVFRNFSTRVHHAGKHHIEVLVNGNLLAKKSFNLQLLITD